LKRSQQQHTGRHMNLFERLARGRPAEERIKPPHKDPAQKLLDWLQHWTKPTISTRDIHIYGPNSIRDRESAINSAQTLVDCGWLIPLKAHRRDMHKWQVVRKTIVHPNVAT